MFKKNIKCESCGSQIDKENIVKNFGKNFCSSTCMEKYKKENNLDQELSSCCRK